VPEGEGRLDAASEARRRRDWATAFELLAGLDEDRVLDAEGLEWLGDAAWACGRFDDADRARERAYAAYSELDDDRGAARVALALAFEHFPRGHIPVARGWLASAQRHLEGLDECPEHGGLQWIRGQLTLLFEGRTDDALAMMDEVVDLARRLHDLDVEMLARSTIGRGLTRLGRLPEATEQLDLAMAAATSGQLRPHTAQIVYCHTLCSCQESQDYERGRSWADVAETCCARDGIVPVRGDCRVHRAGIHLFFGNWSAAEAEARRGSEELAGEMVHRGYALYELGELLRRRGDLAAAERSYRAAEESATPSQPGLALVKLAEGNARTAATMLADALADARAPLSRAVLLPAQVRVALELDDLDTARAAAAELANIAQSFGTTSITAALEHGQGAIALAEGDAESAATLLRHAVRRWQRAGAPFEAAEARVALAAADVARGDRTSAAAELETAGDTFDRLGAALQRRAVTTALQRLDRAAGDDTVVRTMRTFVFTDVVDSTAMLAVIGDDAWFHLRRWHDATLRTLFARYGGQEVKHTGDGFFVVFTDPRAAIDCAIDLQRSLADHRERNGFAPQVRVGIHLADATSAGGDYQGAGVHLAARIGGAARGGEILTSRGTLAAAGLDHHELRHVELKGVPEPVSVASIAWREA
jgi:class 3 adenylate cyclase